MSSRRSILMLCDDHKGHAGTILEHIAAFQRYSRHEVLTFNPRGLSGSRLLDLDEFDAVVIHYSLVVISDHYLAPAFREKIRAFQGVKIQFLQDEYRWVDQVTEMLRYLGVDVLYSVVPAEQIDRLYGTRLPGVERPGLEALPGRLPRHPRQRQRRQHHRLRRLHRARGQGLPGPASTGHLRRGRARGAPAPRGQPGHEHRVAARLRGRRPAHRHDHVPGPLFRRRGAMAALHPAGSGLLQLPGGGGAPARPCLPRRDDRARACRPHPQRALLGSAPGRGLRLRGRCALFGRRPQPALALPGGAGRHLHAPVRPGRQRDGTGRTGPGPSHRLARAAAVRHRPRQLFGQRLRGFTAGGAGPGASAGRARLPGRPRGLARGVRRPPPRGPARAGGAAPCPTRAPGALPGRCLGARRRPGLREPGRRQRSRGHGLGGDRGRGVGDHGVHQFRALERLAVAHPGPVLGALRAAVMGGGQAAPARAPAAEPGAEGTSDKIWRS